VTLLVDPPLLYLAGKAIGRRSQTRLTPLLAIGTGMSFAVVSMATYRDAPPTRALPRIFGTASGKDLILNSKVLRFDPDRASPARERVVAAIFASYPLWGIAGVRAARRGAG